MAVGGKPEPVAQMTTPIKDQIKG